MTCLFHAGERRHNVNTMNELDQATVRIEELLGLLMVGLVTAPAPCRTPINDALMALRMGKARVAEARKRITRLELEKVA